MDVDDHFSALYEDNVSFLLMLCRKRVGYRREYQEIIEDCIQDTFIIAMAKWDTLKDHPNIRAWLVRTCLNLLLPALKKEQASHRITTSLSDEECKSYAPDEDEIEKYLRMAHNRQALEDLYHSLTPKERSVFEDYFLEEKSMRVIASEYGVSENNIKNILKRIRRKSRRQKQKENFW